PNFSSPPWRPPPAVRCDPGPCILSSLLLDVPSERQCAAATAQPVRCPRPVRGSKCQCCAVSSSFVVLGQVGTEVRATQEPAGRRSPPKDARPCTFPGRNRTLEVTSSHRHHTEGDPRHATADSLSRGPFPLLDRALDAGRAGPALRAADGEPEARGEPPAGLPCHQSHGQAADP